MVYVPAGIVRTRCPFGNVRLIRNELCSPTFAIRSGFWALAGTAMNPRAAPAGRSTSARRALRISPMIGTVGPPGQLFFRKEDRMIRLTLADHPEEHVALT